MRDYIKPYIEDEEIEIEDVIAISNGGKGDADTGGKVEDVTKIWPTL